MQYDVIIPTCKDYEEIEPMIEEIKKSGCSFSRLIVTGFKISAAANRNYGLQQAKAPLVVMLDDDIAGFPSGWADMLAAGVIEDVAMVSARLIKEDHSPAVVMNITPNFAERYQEVVPGYLPSACIAFRNDGLRFDEGFEGSSWEDTDFCDTLHVKYPGGRFLIDNFVPVVHRNEQKGGNPHRFAVNKAYYVKKHGRDAV